MTNKKTKQQTPAPAPRRAGRRRNGPRNSAQNPGRRPAGHIRINGVDASLVVHGEELAYTLVSQTDADVLNKTNRINFWPGQTGLTRLDQFGRMYDQYRVRKLHVKYLTASGTVTSGSTITGIDYEASDYPAKLGALQVTQPKIRVPVWESAAMRLDPGRLNKSRWMFTSAGIAAGTPGFTSACAITSSAPPAQILTSYGEVWVEYEVEFTGPSDSNASGQFTANAPGGAWNTNQSAGVDDIVEVVNYSDSMTIRPQTRGVYDICISPHALGTTEFWTQVYDNLNVWGEVETIFRNNEIANYRVDVNNRTSTKWLPAIAAIAYALTIRRTGGSGPSS